MIGSPFIDLHNHSTFSLLDGFGTPKTIVERAKKLNWGAVSITEHGTLMSAPALYKAAKAAKLKPIIGCEFYITPDWALGERGKELMSEQFHLTVLALSREGYENLVAWSTEAMQRVNFYRKPRISIYRMMEIAPWPMHHNVVLSGCLGSELNQTLLHGGSLLHAADYIFGMKSVFPNFYVEIQNHLIPKYYDEQFPAYCEMVEREEGVRKQLIQLAAATDTKLILTNDSHMQSPADRKAHVAMKASAWRTRDDFTTSSERLSVSYLKDYLYFANYMRTMPEIDVPFDAVSSIEEIVKEANIVLDPLDNFSYSLPFSGYKDPLQRMEMRSGRRLAEMIDKHGEKAIERFEYEIEAIGDFAHYLLLISDFIISARKQGILTWTRGSAASSLLCYCLKIHEIDPIEHDLIFSRFYNPARKKLPDIDIDIQPSRYEDFMQIVHEKMGPLVGKGQVEQICNYGTAANRSAFRMAASALGISKEEQDEIAKLLPQMIDSGMVDENTDVFQALATDYPELYEITSSIFDSVKSISQHACAWAFGTPERPLKTWVPMYLIASSGRLVTQFDYKTLEDFGLVKGDFLRLTALDIAADVLKLVGRSPLDFFDLPVDDEKTYEMIRAGKVDGVHTLQGKEVRKGLLAMQPENIYDIVLAAALYRPANTRNNKDKLYVERRQGKEIVQYAHPLLEKILGPTFGLPIFQEQAMEIGYAVGMDDGGVDDIYQAIKKAKGVGRGAKEAFAEIEPDFMEAAKSVGAAAGAFWAEVKEFSGYSFNRAHAASYGVLAAKIAYLKCHYSAEFFAGLLDHYPERSQYLAASRSEGYNFTLPNVNLSEAGFGIDRSSGSIRVGLGKIHGLGPVAVGEILNGQPFQSFEDLKERTTRRSVNATRLENLGRLGVLEPLGIRRTPEDEDLIQFQLLGFTLKKPGAFKGVKPKHVGPRKSSSGWRHLGRERGLDSTESRASVSKLFWVPTGVKLELKASPWANVKTWLMEMVDENGVKFHCLANEDKKDTAFLMKFLHKKCQDRVVCLDGMVRMPFVMNGPQGFRLFSVTGAWEGDPQIFPLDEKDKTFMSAAKSLKGG